MAATSINFLCFNHKNPTSKHRKSVDNPILSMKMEGDRDERRAVDENLIVLRKRIHEIKTKDETNHAPPHSNWWEWEKKWHKRYAKEVVEIVGLLQISVMNGRPSFVLATGAFSVICVAMAMHLILCNLIEILGHAILSVMGLMHALVVMYLAL